MRLLVTGSRTWRNGTLIYERLEEQRVVCKARNDSLIVVHGGCRSGADLIAHGWARWHHLKSSHVSAPEVHPADWNGPCRRNCYPGHRQVPSERSRSGGSRPAPSRTICPRAGAYRNQLMVGLGADLCLAFINDESGGATHCSWLAESAGIPTLRFRSSTTGQLALDI